MSLPSAPPAEEDSIIRSPELPFVSSIVGGLFAGRAVVVSGMVLPGFASDRKKFDIDLCCGLLIDGDHMDNKALHFNPRFEAKAGWFSGPADDKLVINSFVSGGWGAEERFDNPFKEGEPFQLRILVLEKYFKIGIDANGKPTLVAPTPRQEVITQIDKPNIPFVLPLPMGGFVSPQSARFTITPFLSAERFTINLMSKNEFLFHFRVDMPNPAQKIKPAVVRNSSKNGVQWQTEERTFASFPFSKGITHDVVFTAYGKSVTVDVDGAPFVKFVYRDGDDPINIDAITVKGDVLVHRFVHKG
ncbi:hypothetical protein CAEBREN_00946 [Caenorhabditis brenneri]|uniref:Galectin n=1 Tax=Caenorhabditis brenneri TaxID=135651 RepID=G0PEE3_CAEBE|nr:hypothetical protein CAEBREN_00946 [Caenorhabditis brenneri]